MADLILRTELLSVRFGPQFELLQFADARTGTSWLGGPSQRIARPLAGVVLGTQYAPNRREAALGEVKASQEQACVRFSAQGEGVRLAAAARIGNGSLVISLSVTNMSAEEISEVIFPRIEGLSIADTDAGLTIPANNGWWYPLAPLAPDESLTWNYPIYGSMQWVDLCCDKFGLYVGCHDPIPDLKLMSAGKRDGSPFIEFRFTDLALKPGETFDLPPIVLAAHHGDWRAGADIYRSWAEICMGKPDLPRWYQTSPAWSWLHMKPQMAKKPDRVYADIPHEAETRARYGVRLSQMSSWFEGGHDTYYPDYFAGDSLGGEDGLRAAVREVHSRGLRVGLYVNGRIVDPESKILAERPNWKEWAVRGRDPAGTLAMQKLHANFDMPVPAGSDWDESGTIAKEFYGREFAITCPGSPEWRELFIERMCYLAREYGVDGVFIDQVCGCWAYACYAGDHDHDRPGRAWSGYLTMLSTLRERLRAINPEFYMSTEGVGDIFGQYFDIQQGHNDWDTQVGDKTKPLPDLYRYTFPWYTINTGYADRNAYYYLNLAHALGSGLDVCALDGSRTDEAFLTRVRRVMEIRERYAEDLFEGRFAGRLATDNPHFLAFAHTRGERTVVTAAWLPYKTRPKRPQVVGIRIPADHVDVINVEAESGSVPAWRDRTPADALLKIPFSEIAVIELRCSGQRI